MNYPDIPLATRKQEARMFYMLLAMYATLQATLLTVGLVNPVVEAAACVLFAICSGIGCPAWMLLCCLERKRGDLREAVTWVIAIALLASAVLPPTEHWASLPLPVGVVESLQFCIPLVIALFIATVVAQQIYERNQPRLLES